jgi:hypothetical protein
MLNLYFHNTNSMFFLNSLSRMKKERSCSGGTFEFQPGSPSSSRKHLNSKEKPSTTSTSRLRYLQHTNVPLVDLTIFHIPGLDVKVKKYFRLCYYTEYY